MSQLKIRAALEAALASIKPDIDTAWQNAPYKPVTGREYQAAYLLPAAPNNHSMGDGSRQERGIFQINLMYPSGQGSATAAARAEMIAALFRRGASFTKGDVTVQIERTPEIADGREDGDRWMVPVKIRYFCNL
ncbi:phage tail terminator-like protein [Janthinobacterium sp. UMAB-56]|uniref:phage tail terminator-like protein n=1 Tax=Janthinobacterium sp. UMAB-56 TaxID=1365361 RepID=UPI001C55E3F4|nr:phage tail terminator-like protein [Janthinobacterium sp. UMAB-56]